MRHTHPKTVSTQAGFTILLLLCLASMTSAQRLQFEGKERRYILHVPPGVSVADAVPLVLVFHGGSDTPENTQKFTGFSALADRERFIVVYPQGVGKSWADGRGTTAADRQDVDDVGFVRALIEEIRRHHAIDAKRIYATGASNGGIFAHRLGCEMADTFAAIAPVIGGIATKLAVKCKPAAPISVISIQGDADWLTPFEGGEEGGRRGAGGRVEGSRATQEIWRSANGCQPQPVIEKLPARVSDGTTVTRRVYQSCRTPSAVVWYEIHGGGHRWPPGQLTGVAERVARRTLGASSQNLDATEIIWAFFRERAKT